MACRASGLHFPTFDGSSYSGKVSNLSIHPGFLHHMMALPARHPMIRKSIKRAKNIPNSIFAIPAAAPAIPPNPRAAAITETTKKTIAQYSINASFRQKSADRHFSLVRVERTTLAKLACGPQADARTVPLGQPDDVAQQLHEYVSFVPKLGRVPRCWSVLEGSDRNRLLHILPCPPWSRNR